MKRPRSAETDPLPAPAEGNAEIDPWSVPAPEGGYENLELEDEPAPAAASGAAAPPEDAAPADLASTIAARAEAEPPPAPERRSRAALFGIVGAAVAVCVGLAAWLLGGRADERAPGGSGVRVTVTQEVPWNSAPPLAPVDPTYVERRRYASDDAPAPARAAAAAAPAPSPRAAGTAQRPSPPRASAAGATLDAPPEAAAAPPEPEPSPAPPAPVPVQEPAPASAAASPVAASAEIPLPPPPAAAAPQAAAARGRAPVLQTRSCVDDALRIPRGLEGRLPAEVVMRVEVGADGRPSDVAIPGPVDARLASALTAAVRTCRFAPGTSGDGRPAPAPTTMRVRFE